MTQSEKQPLDPSFQASARTELVRLSQELKELDQQMSALQVRREGVSTAVEHLRGLVDPSETLTSGGRPVSGNPGMATADAVVDLLEEHGQPMHYREIHSAIVEQGYTVGGKDPANTLLARFFNDSRLYRPASGTYGLRIWKEGEHESPVQ